MGSISPTLGSPLTLRHCWVFPSICALFPVLHVPSLPSRQTPSKPFVLIPVSFEHESLSLYLSYSLFSFPLLTANLAPSHSLARFLSPSLSCHDIGLWHVWETFAGPLLQKGHWYTECWVTWAISGTVNMRTSFPKAYLYPRGLLATRSNTEAEMQHVHHYFSHFWSFFLCLNQRYMIRLSEYLPPPCFYEVFQEHWSMG